jgi:hypothetical protein
MQHEHIKQQAQKLGLNGGDLAALANLNAPTVSQFLRGRKSLKPEKVQEITAVLHDLEELKKHFPVPVGFHDMKIVALALERLRKGQFEEFKIVMQGTDWEEPEQSELERKFPRIFKEK